MKTTFNAELLIFGQTNKNGRCYEIEAIDLLELNNRAKKGMFFGSSVIQKGNSEVDLFNATHQFKSFSINNGALWGHGVFTHKGRALNELIEKTPMQIVFRPRGVGHIREDGTVHIDEIISFDAIPKSEDSFITDTPIQLNHQEQVKLHLGSGTRNFGPDWIHISADDLPHIYSHDVTRLPFDDNLVDTIYASHLIAYFDQYEIKEVLKEWFKVLRPGGTIRLATPDFRAIAKLYVEMEYPLNDFIGPLYGRWQVGDNLGYHKVVYDFHKLRTVLEEAGFICIRKYDWKNTEHSQFDDHSRAHYPHDPEAIASGVFTDRHTLISLNVEAKKP